MSSIDTVSLGLFNRARSRDPEAADLFLQRCGRDLLRLGCYYLGKFPRLDYDPEDLLQDVYLVCFCDNRPKKAFTEPAQLRSYLRTVIHNTVLHKIREFHTQKRDAGQVVRLPDNVQAKGHPVPEALEVVDSLDNLLAHLPPTQRDVLVRLIHGDCYPHIAASLRLSESYVSRVAKQVITALENDLPDNTDREYLDADPQCP
jgi:RNA polymerase sigma factor (sigma-70 family)